MRARTPDVEVTRTMAPEEVPYLMTARQVAGWTGRVDVICARRSRRVS